MKRMIVFIMCMVSLICLSGCDVLGLDSKPAETTYRVITVFPEFEEMKEKLEKHGYVVVITDTAGPYKGKGFLAANPDNEYIEFYKLDNAEDCDALYDQVGKEHKEMYKSVKMIDDPEHGNVVFICTKLAMYTAGVQYDTVCETVTK